MSLDDTKGNADDGGTEAGAFMADLRLAAKDRIANAYGLAKWPIPLLLLQP
jgi:hypothetical protein